MPPPLFINPHPHHSPTLFPCPFINPLFMFLSFFYCTCSCPLPQQTYLSQPSRLLKHSPFFGVLSGKAPPPLSSHPPHQGPYPPLALLSAEKSTPPYYSYFAPPPVVMGAHTHIHPHHLPFPTSVPTLPLVSCAQTYASTHTEMFSLPPLVWLHTTLLLSPTVAVRLQQCSHVLTFSGAFLSPKRLFLPSCLFPLFSP